MATLLDFISQRPDFRPVRIPSLYSDFRQLKKSNPDGFNTNVQAWELSLREATKKRLTPGHDSIFTICTGPELEQALESDKYGRPMAVGAVIDKAVSAGRMARYEEFVEPESSPGWRLWHLKSWAWYPSRLIFSQSAAATPSGRFIFVETVKETAKAVLNQLKCQQSRPDRIMPLNLFDREVSRALNLDAGISASDLKALIVYMAEYEHTILVGDDAILVKARNESAQSAMTAQDAEIARVKRVICDLSMQIEDLTNRASIAAQKAQCAVKAQSQPTARRHLRSKLGLERLISKRSEMLGQLESAYDGICDAVDQAQFLEAIKSSTSVLKDLNSRLGGPEEVATVMDSLQEQKHDLDEVGEALGSASKSMTDGDEEDLRLELEKLEIEEAESRLESAGQIPMAKPAPGIEASAPVANSSPRSRVLEESNWPIPA